MCIGIWVYGSKIVVVVVKLFEIIKYLFLIIVTYILNYTYILTHYTNTLHIIITKRLTVLTQ